MSDSGWVLGPGAVGARTIKGPVTTAITLVHGVRDRLADAIFDPSPLYETLDLARFTGRAELIAQIDAYIESHRSGYVLIRGEAGVGKSTLAAHLVWNRWCVHHFTRIEGARSPEQARRSIAAQFISAWDLASELGLEEDFPAVADRPDWLVKVLWAAAQRRDELDKDLRLVLVVDGLDEADPPAPGRETGIPLGLPRPESLPEGVFIVATSRYGPPLAAIRDPDSWHTIEVDGAANLADMRRFLRDAVDGDHPLPELVVALARGGVEGARFVETLSARCAGVWIYLRYVLDDIVIGRCSPREVASLPEGLAGYYLEQIERWHTAADWAVVGQPVLAMLVALRRPVGQRDLARLVGLSDDERLRSWVDGAFRSFVNLSRPPSRERRYEIRHQSFRDLFSPSQHDDDRDDGIREALHHALTLAHQRISTALMSEVRAGFPYCLGEGYTRSALADHVTAAGMLDQFATDPVFLLACDPSALLRLRSAASTSEARSALAAYELSLSDQDLDTRLWWLHVWARKVRCHRLADLAAEWRTPSWAVTAAIWAGTTHRTLSGHTSFVNAVCSVALPDGRTLLASASSDDTVRLWDPVTGQPVGEPLTGHTGGVHAVCSVALPDGRTLLASASHDKTLRLWDPVTGQPVGEPLTGHTDWVDALFPVPLPDGRTLLASASEGYEVWLWDPVTGQPTGRPLTGHIYAVRAVCAVPLPDGRTLLASASDDATVRLWDPVTGHPTGRPLTGHIYAVRAVCAVPLPDGRTLLASASDDATVRLWDPVTGQPVGEPLTGHTEKVHAVCSVPLPDGRTLLASGSNDKTLRLWDPITGQPIGEPLTGNTYGVNAVCPVSLPDGGTLLASADSYTLRLWDPFTDQLVGEPLTGHTSRVRAVCSVVLPDGRTLLASGSGDGMVRLWDPVTGQPVGEPLTGHTSRVRAVCSVVLPDGRTLLASASDDATVRLWDPVTGQPIGKPLTGHTKPVWAVCPVPVPDGRTLLASGSNDRMVRLWDPITGQRIGEPLTGHTEEVYAVCPVPLPDGRTLLASASDDATVRLWDPVTGQPIGEPLISTSPVWSVCPVPLPDRRTLLAVALRNATVWLWDPVTGQPVGEPLTGHTMPVYAVCPIPVPDGRTLLASAGTDATVRLWDPVTGQPVGEPFTGHTDEVNAVCSVALPDGRTALASASLDRSVLIWTTNDWSN